MEIELQNFDEITIIPKQFVNEEKPPKFIFKSPNAADIIDFQIYNDASRLASRCFLRFENKPVLKKDGKALEYNTYSEFIGLGSSETITAIHAQCCGELIPLIYKTKEKAEKTEKK